MMRRRAPEQEDDGPLAPRLRLATGAAGVLALAAGIRALWAGGVAGATYVGLAVAFALLLVVGGLAPRRVPARTALTTAACGAAIWASLAAPGAQLLVAAWFVVANLLAALPRRAALEWLPLASVACGLVAFAHAPGAGGALLLPPLVAAALVGQALVETDAARRRVARRALLQPPPSETQRGVRARVAYVLPLTLLLLAFAALLAPVVAAAPRLGRGRPSGGARAARQPRAPLDLHSGAFAFKPDLTLDGIPMPAYEELMEVVPEQGGRSLGNIGALLLRGLVLSELRPSGARLRGMSEPPRIEDASDGVVDGSVRLAPVPPAAETLHLRVSQYPLPIAPHEWCLLFATEAAYSVDVPDVRFDPDRLLVATESPDDWFTYRVEVLDPRVPRPGLDAARAAHDDAAYVALPSRPASLLRVATAAHAILRGVRGDAARVRELCRHLRTTCTYSLEDTAFPGLDGLAEVLDRRSGFCTQFATLATVMLRSQGIPTRIATGFHVNEWDAARGAYLVRPRDVHAWIEVHFEGIGWVAFDPTPPDGRAAAAEAQAPEQGETARWTGDLLDELGAIVAGSGGDVGRLIDAVRRAPPAVRRGLLAALALLVALAGLVRLAAARARPRRSVPHELREADELYERIASALARHGFRRHPAQTRHEFAQAVVHAGGVALRPLDALTDELSAVRFGGHEVGDDLRARVAAFVHELRRRHG